MFAAVFALSAAGVGLWVGSGPREPDHRIVSVAVSSSSRWIAAGTHTGSIAVLDQDRPSSLRRVSAGTGELNDLQFNPDDGSLAIANRDLAVLSVPGLNLRSVRSDDRNYGTVRFSSDGKFLLTITGQATIETLDAESGELQLKVCCSTIGGEIALSPDGTLIVTAGHWPALWDARSGQLVRRLTRDREFLTFLAIAFDTRRDWVLMGSQDGRVYAWDLRTGQRTATSPGSAGYADSIAMLRDSSWIAYSSRGGQVRLWNPDSGIERQSGSMKTSSNLVAGAKRDSIFFGTETGFVELWDTAEETMSGRYDLR